MFVGPGLRFWKVYFFGGMDATLDEFSFTRFSRIHSVGTTRSTILSAPKSAH